MSRSRARHSVAIIAALTLCLVLGFAVPEANAATLGIYFDAGGVNEGLEVPTFSVFTFYAVASGVGSGVIGYEFELEFSDAITVLSSTVHPANSINLGGSNSWVVGTNECYGGGGSFVLVTFTAMLTREGSNFALRASGLEDGSIDDETPAYVPCDDRTTAYGFDETPAGYVNPKADSFGRMKERFDS